MIRSRDAILCYLAEMGHIKEDRFNPLYPYMLIKNHIFNFAADFLEIEDHNGQKITIEYADPNLFVVLDKICQTK